MKFNLFETSKEKIIVAAHRGAAGGNIPCNTLAAYEIALMQGADMLETDIDISADGVLVIFHPGMEKSHLGAVVKLGNLTYEEIKSLRYVNYDGVPTQFGISSFDDFLETFKGRCFINVDKFWDNPEKIYAAVKRHGMTDQVLVKSTPTKEVLDVLEAVSPEIPFLPIVSKEHPLHKSLMDRKINYVGAEILFTSESDPVASPEFFEMMRRDGKLVWTNTIIFNHLRQLSAGHSDDTALTGSMENGWGWHADRGVDIIQTDWPLMLVNYLKETGRYFRK